MDGLTKNLLSMKSIIFATSNPHKISEVQKILSGQYHIQPMSEIGCHEDIPETSPTIEGNALQKARYLHQNYQVDCFSEDTGLEIDALNGEPGVITARYAGPQRDSIANMELALQKLGDTDNRSARFRTVIALILDQKEYTFEGIVEGQIARQRSGDGGFGYDPVFVPDGFDKTFAELPVEIKNQISHRARAVEKLVQFLKNLAQ